MTANRAATLGEAHGSSKPIATKLALAGKHGCEGQVIDRQALLSSDVPVTGTPGSVD